MELEEKVRPEIKSELSFIKRLFIPGSVFEERGRQKTIYGSSNIKYLDALLVETLKSFNLVVLTYCIYTALNKYVF